jgi:hypothetical protein
MFCNRNFEMNKQSSGIGEKLLNGSTDRVFIACAA